VQDFFNYPEECAGYNFVDPDTNRNTLKCNPLKAHSGYEFRDIEAFDGPTGHTTMPVSHPAVVCLHADDDCGLNMTHRRLFADANIWFPATVRTKRLRKSSPMENYYDYTAKFGLRRDKPMTQHNKDLQCFGNGNSSHVLRFDCAGYNVHLQGFVPAYTGTRQCLSCCDTKAYGDKGLPDCWSRFGRKSDPSNQLGNGNFASCCKVLNTEEAIDSLWDGRLPDKFEVGAPTGMQLRNFTIAVTKWQAYCARNQMPSLPLYDSSLPGKPALEDSVVQAWVSDLFDQWLLSRLQLPMKQVWNNCSLTWETAVLYEADGSQIATEYGEGAKICARLPSAVNFVSACDCHANPQCESATWNKYTYFLGTKSVVADYNISSALPVSCSYFRMLELLNTTRQNGSYLNADNSQSGYTPLTDITRQFSDRRTRTSGVHTGFTASEKWHLDNSGVQEPYNLRKALSSAMVRKWYQEGLIDHEALASYYEQCSPYDCYYDERPDLTLIQFITVMLGLIGGLVAMVRSGVDVGIDTITSVLCGIKVKNIVQLLETPNKGIEGKKVHYTDFMVSTKAKGKADAGAGAGAADKHEKNDDVSGPGKTPEPKSAWLQVPQIKKIHPDGADV